MQSEPERANEPFRIGWGERIVIWTALAVITILGLIGFHQDGETGFWVALGSGLLTFIVVHGVFATQFRAFYCRFKPTRYDGAVEDALNVASFLLRK